MGSLSILALVTDAFGGRGGIAQYNRDFLSALARVESVQSIVALPRMAPDPVEPPAGVTQLPARLGRIGYAVAALRIALGRQFDIVFCGHLYMAPLAWLVARLCGARLVVQLHGIEAWPRPSRWRRAAVDAADIVLCVSRYTRARITGWSVVAPERVLVLPNTVSEAFSPGDGAALRGVWGVEGKRVLLTVGRMDARERYKGHDRTMAIIPSLVAAGFDVVYVVLGDGNDRARLEAMARDTGVADRVRFLGSAKVETLLAAYRTADLFVLPSTGEGFGIAFLEAMACGTPALGLDVAGASDALGDGELGMMVGEADFGAAVTAVLARGKPDAEAVSRAVRVRFGAGPFAAGARAVVARLQEAA